MSPPSLIRLWELEDHRFAIDGRLDTAVTEIRAVDRDPRAVRDLSGAGERLPEGHDVGRSGVEAMDLEALRMDDLARPVEKGAGERGRQLPRAGELKAGEALGLFFGRRLDDV